MCTKKRICLVLSLAVLAACLWGCGAKKTQSQQTEPSESQPLVEATESTAPTETTVPEPTAARTQVQWDGFVCGEVAQVRSEPDFGAAVTEQLTTGARVHITELYELEGSRWAQTDKGWVDPDQLFIPQEPTREPFPALVRNNDTWVYDAVLGDPEHLQTLQAGVRVFVLEQVQAGGENWAYAEGGWIRMRNLYIEGTPGSRPCTGVVDDSSSLNVRRGPSMDQDVIRTLPDGAYVQVLERINCRGNDWGFIGDGWIYMDLVKIQESEMSGSWQENPQIP